MRPRVVYARAEFACGSSRARRPGRCSCRRWARCTPDMPRCWRAARRDSDAVVATVFVNPTPVRTRRGPRPLPALAGRRPRALRGARRRPGLGAGGRPTSTRTATRRSRSTPGPLGAQLEGAARPGHFAGVLTVVAKLFALTRPGRGLLRREGLPAADADPAHGPRPRVRRRTSSACPTVREPDGLALSSRNALPVGRGPARRRWCSAARCARARTRRPTVPTRCSTRLGARWPPSRPSSSTTWNCAALDLGPAPGTARPGCSSPRRSAAPGSSTTWRCSCDRVNCRRRLAAPRAGLADRDRRRRRRLGHRRPHRRARRQPRQRAARRCSSPRTCSAPARPAGRRAASPPRSEPVTRPTSTSPTPWSPAPASATRPRSGCWCARARPRCASWSSAAPGSTAPPTARLSLTREGGHHRDRIAHAGGDATGAEIERALVDRGARDAAASR